MLQSQVVSGEKREKLSMIKIDGMAQVAMQEMKIDPVLEGGKK